MCVVEETTSFIVASTSQAMTFPRSVHVNYTKSSRLRVSKTGTPFESTENFICSVEYFCITTIEHNSAPKTPN